MTKADGSVVIQARVDAGQADKDLAKLKNKISDLENDIKEKESQRSPLIEEAEKIRAKMEQARKEVEEYKKAWMSGVVGADRDQTLAQEKYTNAKAEYEDVVEQIEKIDAKILPAQEKLEKMTEEAGELAKNINTSAKSTEKFSVAQGKASKSAQKFASRLKAVVRSALIFTVVTKALSALREWAAGLVTTNEEARSSVSRLKGALLTMAQPLVNVVIPAFIKVVDVLTAAAVTIGNLFAAIGGTTYEEAKNSADALNKEQEAIQGVGDAAKGAEKQLASFDKINKLGDSGKKSEYIAPDFSSLKEIVLPDWLTNFSLKINDIVFDWSDLTTGDIVEKIVAGLVGLAIGGLLFTVGGVKGAVIGMVVGTAITASVLSFLFNDDGKLDAEEITKSLLTVLVSAVGGVIGFTLGGVGGAVIGATIGMSVSALLGKVIFNNDGKVESGEIAKLLCAALGGLVGGVIGFTVGGPGGAFIGATIGASATILLSNAIFDGDGKLNTKEVLDSLCTAAGAIVGAAIGFAVGGPLGAAIGLTVGAVLTVVIKDVVYEWFGNLKEDVPNFTGIGPDYSWMFGGKKKSDTPISVPVPSIAQGTLLPSGAMFAQGKTALMEQFFPAGGFGSVTPSQSGNTTVILEIDKTEFARAVYSANANESNRIGLSMVGGHN